MEISIENSRIRREEEEHERMVGRQSGSYNHSSGYDSNNRIVYYQGSGSVERWRPLVSQFIDWDINTMLRIMEGESDGDPTAWNKETNCKGLFQIQDTTDAYPYELWTDPWWNTQAAHETWLSQGYEAWEVY